MTEWVPVVVPSLTISGQGFNGGFSLPGGGGGEIKGGRGRD